MKRIIVSLVSLVSIFFLTGCSATEFSARGGPGVLLKLANDLGVQGGLKTSPGGFVERNQDSRLGALVNEEQGVSKDIEIFVQGEQNIWIPYRGPAEVYTLGWIKVFEDGKWKKVKLSSRWLKVDGLEAIHFESAFAQTVTLRTSSGEIFFKTAGLKENGNNYKRINILFIKLPERQYGYRLNVYAYTGQLFFKSVRGAPYTHPLSFDGDPTDYKFGNQWIGWKSIL